MNQSRTIPREISFLSNENVVMTLKRRYPSLITSFLASFIGILSVGSGSIIGQISSSPNLSNAIANYLYAIVVAIVLVLVVALLIGYFYVRGHLYVLTNRRIILFRKFITISIREVAYKEITDVIVNQGPIARILNYGSVTPLSPGVRISHALPYPYMRGSALFRVSLRDVNQPCKTADQLYQLIRSSK